MNCIKVVYDAEDRTGQIYREEYIFKDVEEVVKDVTDVYHTMGHPISETYQGYIREFRKWNRSNRLCNWGFYGMKITIQDFA